MLTSNNLTRCVDTYPERLLPGLLAKLTNADRSKRRGILLTLSKVVAANVAMLENAKLLPHM
jgi:hypothetical protein